MRGPTRRDDRDEMPSSNEESTSTQTPSSYAPQARTAPAATGSSATTSSPETAATSSSGLSAQTALSFKSESSLIAIQPAKRPRHDGEIGHGGGGGIYGGPGRGGGVAGASARVGIRAAVHQVPEEVAVYKPLVEQPGLASSHQTSQLISSPPRKKRLQPGTYSQSSTHQSLMTSKFLCFLFVLLKMSRLESFHANELESGGCFRCEFENGELCI